MIKEYIIMLDPRGVISRDATTFLRHIEYGKALNKQNHKYQLLIFTSCDNLPATQLHSETTQVVEIVKGRFIPVYSFRVRRIIRKKFNNRPLTYVVGDPWVGYLSYRAIAAFRKQKSRLQVQIHAEIGNPIWYKSNLKNYLKHLLARVAMRNADSIRAVSTSQSIAIQDKYKVPSEKLVVIPPLLNVIPGGPRIVKDRPRTLAFVGRVDLDRGTGVLPIVCSRLMTVDQGFQVEVVGIGPEIEDLRTKLESMLGLSRVKFHGLVSTEKLSRLWNQFGVLISLSETESYGRTIREAIYSGLPVWSTLTSGLEDLIDERGAEGIAILDPLAEPQEMLKVFNTLLSSDIEPLSSGDVEELQSTRLKSLCESWITLNETKF
jgi:glycosyltransferase involved in cell wall biosynthesis